MNKDWLDIGVLEDYLDGKLDAKTMNRVEREALDDPFVAEALSGLSESPKRSLQSISLLQKQLHERVAQHQSIKKTSVITWQRLSIAATAAVMFVAVSIMFWMRENNHQKELAGRPKKVEVTIAPKTPSESRVAAEVPVLAAESAGQEKEIDKAVKAAKTNSYAARTKAKSSAGHYKINIADPIPLQSSDQSLNETMVASSMAKKKEVEADSAAVNGTLEEKVAGINTGSTMVSIRGMSSSPKMPVMVSNPVGGWDKLFTYIQTNNSFVKETKTGQSVELSFRIDKKGTPTDIKVVKGADDQYEQEAIRLILNGPKWERPAKSRSRMTFKIDF